MKFNIGIGIHYGDVIVGSIGSSDNSDCFEFRYLDDVKVKGKEKALTESPNDKAARLMLDRCIEFIQNPPESWDGAITFHTK